MEIIIPLPPFIPAFALRSASSSFFVVLKRRADIGLSEFRGPASIMAAPLIRSPQQLRSSPQPLTKSRDASASGEKALGVCVRVRECVCSRDRLVNVLQTLQLSSGRGYEPAGDRGRRAVMAYFFTARCGWGPRWVGGLHMHKGQTLADGLQHFLRATRARQDSCV